MVPGSVGDGFKNGIALHGNDALRDVGQRVVDDGEKIWIAAAETPNGIAWKQRVNLHYVENLLNINLLVINVKKFLPFGCGAELQDERILSLGCVSVALRLEIETEIDRIGGSDGSWCGLKDGVEADACRGEIFGDKRVADGIVVDFAVFVKNVQSDSVSRWRIQRETIVDQNVSVRPFRGIGIDPRLAEIIKKRQSHYRTFGGFADGAGFAPDWNPVRIS